MNQEAIHDDITSKVFEDESKKQRKSLFKFEKLGRLKSEVQLHLNTIDSQLLFLGHLTKNGIGLLRFSGQMSKIWNAAAKDDPYADYYLLKVYDSIIKQRHQLIATIKHYEQKLLESASFGGQSIQPFTSEKPAIKSLWFRTQYGYLCAGLIADFDQLLRIILTAYRIGILLDKSYEMLRDEWEEHISSILKLPFKWQDLNITRADMDADTEVAQKAKAVMGQLPDLVLMKKLRSPFSPKIVNQDQKDILIEEDSAAVIEKDVELTM